MKKIGIVMILVMAVECLAFPEILFPDCVGKTQTESNHTIEENENIDYQFRSFLLKYFMEKKRAEE